MTTNLSTSSTVNAGAMAASSDGKVAVERIVTYKVDGSTGIGVTCWKIAWAGKPNIAIGRCLISFQILSASDWEGGTTLGTGGGGAAGVGGAGGGVTTTGVFLGAFLTGFLVVFLVTLFFLLVFLVGMVFLRNRIQKVHISANALLKALVSVNPLIRLTSLPSFKIKTVGMESIENLVH
jgi:hypothetical protein